MFMCVTIDRVWIGEWIYWPLIHTTRNYKHIQHYCRFPHFTNHYTLSVLHPAVSWLSRCLVTAHNNGNSTASVLMSLLSGDWTIAPSLLILPCRTQLSTDWVAQVFFLTTPLHEPSRRHCFFIAACIFVAAGMYFLICCLEMAIVYSHF
jgi:hypothetical protein